MEIVSQISFRSRERATTGNHSFSRSGGHPGRNAADRQVSLIFWRHLAVGLLILFLSGLLTAFWALGIEPDLLSVTRLTVVDANLPPSWDGRVVAFFTDIHAGSHFDERRLGRVADAIAAAEPDLILFGGDLVDHHTPDDRGFSAAISQCLARMQAPFGQYAIVGNHDNRLRAELNLAKAILKDGGFQLLVNQSVLLDSLWLGGLDESYFGSPDLNQTFPDSAGSGAGAGNQWRLLLMHQPDYAASLPDDAARLILSGHTHGGQVALFGYPLTTVYQGRLYTYGRYQLENSEPSDYSRIAAGSGPPAGSRQLIVSRGLGTINLPVRCGAPPELMLITLRRF